MHKTLKKRTREEKHQKVSTTLESQDKDAHGQETVNARDDPKQKGQKRRQREVGTLNGKNPHPQARLYLNSERDTAKPKKKRNTRRKSSRLNRDLSSRVSRV